MQKNEHYFYGRVSITCFFKSLFSQQQDAYCSNILVIFPWTPEDTATKATDEIYELTLNVGI